MPTDTVTVDRQALIDLIIEAYVVVNLHNAADSEGYDAPLVQDLSRAQWAVARAVFGPLTDDEGDPIGEWREIRSEGTRRYKERVAKTWLWMVDEEAVTADA